MGKKIRVNITVDEDIHRKARELGLNVSKVCENALKQIVQRLTSPTSNSNLKKGGIGTVGSDWWGCPDLNRGQESPSLHKTPTVSYHLPFEVDWDGFGEWLQSTHDDEYGRKLVSYAKKWCWVFGEPERASVISGLSRDKRRLVMSALANFGKYIGRYGYWKWIVANAGLRYEKKTSIETVFGILESDLRSLESWLIEALKSVPQRHASVLAFTAVTGLRPSEGCMATKLITELARNDSLDNYFNRKLMMLEHFRYGELFLRGSKNAYISFVPKQMLDCIIEVKPAISYAALIHVLQRRDFQVRVKELRHLHATKLREHVPREVIDLLHGRVGQNVFMRYYYEPFLNEIKQKVLAAVEPFSRQLLSTIS